MSDYRKGYVQWKGRDYKVTWHPISKEVYVWWGTDEYCGKAYDMQEALDIALSWLNNHSQGNCQMREWAHPGMGALPRRSEETVRWHENLRDEGVRSNLLRWFSRDCVIRRYAAGLNAGGRTLQIVGPQARMLRDTAQDLATEFVIVVKGKLVVPNS